MAAPNFQFYEYDDVDLISTLNPIDFGDVPRGSQGIPVDTLKQGVNLWNDRDGIAGSEEAVNIRISVLPDDADLNTEVFIGTAGNAFDPFLEARSNGAVNVSDDAQSAWTPISNDEFLEIGDMPRNSMRRIELRLNVPQDAASFVSKNYKLLVNYETA